MDLGLSGPPHRVRFLTKDLGPSAFIAITIC
jgi:hypothetical protein